MNVNSMWRPPGAETVEFRLAVECCRWAFAGGDQGEVRKLVMDVNWDRFIDIVRFHRVQGLVWKCLSVARCAPDPVSEQLAGEARAIAAANLRMAVEARRLHGAFAEAGIAVLFVKGLTLGQLAYGDALLKMGWDIDLLIDPADLGRAATLIGSLGYRLRRPAETRQLAAWHRRNKDSEWASREGIHVELHTRLTENSRLLPGTGIRSPSRVIALAPGIAVPTLQEEELFAYLCVHGASSLWFRLKWITDLAAILHPLNAGQIARLYASSQVLGAGRTSACALLLADALYGSLRGSPLRDELTGDRQSRWLYRAAFRQLAGRPDPREPTAKIGGTARIHLAQLLSLPGARFKLSELARQVRAVLA
ncbi:MAG: nucleotidyltransferase family protein [Sphingomicrobium sp.]